MSFARCARLCFVLPSLLAALLAAAASAAQGLTPVWEQVDAWQGRPVATLATDLERPLASPLYLELVEGLLARGFEVAPTGDGPAASDGLRIELQLTAPQPVLAVRRASDGAFLAVERLEAQTAPPATAGAEPEAAPPRQRARTAPTAGQRWSLDDHPRRLAALTAPGGEPLLALLEDDGLHLARLGPAGPQTLARLRHNLSTTHALYLGTAELEGGGTPELLALWGQDHRSPSHGTNTRLVGRAVTLDGDRPRWLGTPLEGYLRAVGGEGFFQARRRDTALFTPPVQRLAVDGGTVVPDGAVPAWREGWLFGHTPLSGGGSARWDADGALVLAADGGASSSIRLGAPRAPVLNVRQRAPEFPFSAQDAQLHLSVPLPQRVMPAPDSGVYTVRHGRAALVSKLDTLTSRGADQVVALAAGREPRGLSPELQNYILDFALTTTDGEPLLLILLNEASDGSGKAELMALRPPR